jgi:predicted alpha/beta hydrolase
MPGIKAEVLAYYAIGTYKGLSPWMKQNLDWNLINLFFLHKLKLWLFPGYLNGALIGNLNSSKVWPYLHWGFTGSGPSFEIFEISVWNIFFRTIY